MKIFKPKREAGKHDVEIMLMMPQDPDIQLLHHTNFQGRFCYMNVRDNKLGYEKVRREIEGLSKQVKTVVLGLPILGMPGKDNENETIHYNLIKKYGSGIIRFIKLSKDDEYKRYLYEDGVDVSWDPDEKVSVVLFEYGMLAAMMDHLTTIEEPYGTSIMLQIFSSLLYHRGFCRMACSIGKPPSLKDIKYMLAPDQFRKQFSLGVVCPDVFYTLLVNDDTTPIENIEEFDKTYADHLANYSKYGPLTGEKLALLEVCRSHKLELWASQLNDDTDIIDALSDDDIPAMRRLTSADDYVTAVELQDPHSIIA